MMNASQLARALRSVQARLERERLEHEVLDRSNLVLALQVGDSAASSLWAARRRPESKAELHSAAYHVCGSAAQCTLSLV